MTDEEWKPIYDRMKEYCDTLLKGQEELLKQPCIFINNKTGLPPTEEEKKEIMSHFNKSVARVEDYLKKANSEFVMKAYNNIPIIVDNLDKVHRRNKNEMVWASRHPNKKMPERWDRSKTLWKKNEKTYQDNLSLMWEDDEEFE